MIEESLYIIPNENILETDIFYSKLVTGHAHVLLARKFFKN